MFSSFLVLSLALGGAGRAGWGQGAPGRVPGWEKTSFSAHYTASDLHKYLDGGAAKYLAYSIKELHVQEYERGGDAFKATVEIYRMDSPRNAFGVYSCDQGGEHPDGTGEAGSYEGGLLQFWQDVYYVRIQAVDPSGETGPAIIELGRSVSRALGGPERSARSGAEVPERHTGSGSAGASETGRSVLPSLVATLPRSGLIEDSVCFFHNQVSLNRIYYFSGENLLRLGSHTDAVYAEYRRAPDFTAGVIAICYPEADSASAALESLEAARSGGETYEDGDLSGSCALARGRVLAIVLNASSAEGAQALCREVLDAVTCSGASRPEENK